MKQFLKLAAGMVLAVAAQEEAITVKSECLKSTGRLGSVLSGNTEKSDLEKIKSFGVTD
jgi:hypothetical protein